MRNYPKSIFSAVESLMDREAATTELALTTNLAASLGRGLELMRATEVVAGELMLELNLLILSITLGETTKREERQLSRKEQQWKGKQNRVCNSRQWLPKIAHARPSCTTKMSLTLFWEWKVVRTGTNPHQLQKANG